MTALLSQGRLYQPIQAPSTLDRLKLQQQDADSIEAAIMWTPPAAVEQLAVVIPRNGTSSVQQLYMAMQQLEVQLADITLSSDGTGVNGVGDIVAHWHGQVEAADERVRQAAAAHAQEVSALTQAHARYSTVPLWAHSFAPVGSTCVARAFMFTDSCYPEPQTVPRAVGPYSM